MLCYKYIACLVLFCTCRLMGLPNTVSLYSSAAPVNKWDSQALLNPLVLCTCEFLIDLSSTTSILCSCFTHTWVVAKHCFILYVCCCYTSLMGKHCVILCSFCTYMLEMGFSWFKYLDIIQPVCFGKWFCFCLW
jgi:hypothetical protein